MNPLYDMDNEVTAVVNGDFRTPDGKYIRGAYTTKEDSLVLVDVNVFERLIYEGVVETNDLQEEINKYIEAHKKEIAEEYIREQELAKEAERKAKVEEHLKSVREERSKKAQQNEALILKGIMQGYSRTEIMEDLQVSSSTVAKVIKKLSPDYVHTMYTLFRHSIFKDVSVSVYNSFEQAGFSYKRMQQLRGKRRADAAKRYKELKKKVDEVNEALGVVTPKPKEKKEFADIDDIIAEFGESVQVL